MAGNITVAIVIILIIGGIIFGCWVDRADTKIADSFAFLDCRAFALSD